MLGVLAPQLWMVFREKLRLKATELWIQIR